MSANISLHSPGTPDGYTVSVKSGEKSTWVTITSGTTDITIHSGGMVEEHSLVDQTIALVDLFAEATSKLAAKVRELQEAGK